MLSLGIRPGDSLKLLEYSEVSWFIGEVKRIKQNEANRKSQRLAEAFRMAQVSTHKKGFATYVKWFRGLEDNIKISEDSQPKRTVFEILKNKKEESETLFSKVKKFKNKLRKKGK